MNFLFFILLTIFLTLFFENLIKKYFFKKNFHIICRPNVLDSSAIIDGRIIGLLENGFLDGFAIIPAFVVEELTILADSGSPEKRKRGKRGLEFVNYIISNIKNAIILNKDFENLKGVDKKIVQLTKNLDGKLLTTDNNLVQNAILNNVFAVNIYTLQQKMSLILQPLQEISVKLINKGTRDKQAIGNLKDGTMVVVNEIDEKLIGTGKEVKLLVKKVCSTSGGRIVFAVLKDK